MARRRRPHPLGAARFPAALGRGRKLADQPGGTALGVADGPGRPVSARARPQMRRVRTPRGRRVDRLRQPRGRPRRCPPHAGAARLAFRPSGDPGRCDGLVRLGSGEWNCSGGPFFRVHAPRAVARLQPPIDGESFPVSEDMGNGLEHRAPPQRPRSRRRAGPVPGHRRRGRDGRVRCLLASLARVAPSPHRHRRSRGRRGPRQRQRVDRALRIALPDGRRHQSRRQATRLRREVGEFLVGSCIRREPALQHTHIQWAAAKTRSAIHEHDAMPTPMPGATTNASSCPNRPSQRWPRP